MEKIYWVVVISEDPRIRFKIIPESKVTSIKEAKELHESPFVFRSENEARECMVEWIKHAESKLSYTDYFVLEENYPSWQLKPVRHFEDQGNPHKLYGRGNIFTDLGKATVELHYRNKLLALKEC